jgi:AcrR family transcriptional regulator
MGEGIEAGFFLRASDYLQNLPAVSTARLKKNLSERPGTHRRLLDAARAEFGEKGIEAATTRGIAERAGCNEVTLFRHFESKQKLLAAVVQETSEQFLAFCECQGDFSGNPREDLARFARVYSESLERCEGMARALIGEGRRRPTLVKELIGDVLEPFHRSIASYLDLRKKDGLVRESLDTMAFAEVFTSTLMGGLLRRSSGLSGLDREGWIRETVDILVCGIG